jgi:hypothetical protein
MKDATQAAAIEAVRKFAAVHPGKSAEELAAIIRKEMDPDGKQALVRYGIELAVNAAFRERAGSS